MTILCAWGVFYAHYIVYRNRCFDFILYRWGGGGDLYEVNTLVSEHKRIRKQFYRSALIDNLFQYYVRIPENLLCRPAVFLLPKTRFRSAALRHLFQLLSSDFKLVQ
jgi:hypothetical protein